MLYVMSGYKKCLYLKKNFYKPAGEKIGELLSTVISLGLTTPERINLVGYSIGAQVAGYAARLVNSEFSPINYIAGISVVNSFSHS